MAAKYLRRFTGRQNEVLALTVCSMLEADYERIQHERLAQKMGLSREWIAAAARSS